MPMRCASVVWMGAQASGAVKDFDPLINNIELYSYSILIFSRRMLMGDE